MLAVEYWNQKVILLRILWTRSWSLNGHRSLRSNCSWKEALTRTTTTTTKTLLAWTGIEPIALHTAPPSELPNDLGTDHLNHNVVFRKRKLLAKETLTGDLSLLHLASRNHKERINAIHYGEQSWRSGDGTRLPPMCPCLDSRNVCGLSLLVVVTSRSFLPVVFPSDQKPNFSFDLFHLIFLILFIYFFNSQPGQTSAIYCNRLLNKHYHYIIHYYYRKVNWGKKESCN